MIQTIETGVRGTQSGNQKTAVMEFLSKISSHEWEIENATLTDPADRSLADSPSFIGSRRIKMIKIDAKLIEGVENYKFLTYRKILD
jgi:hypothetical protein